MVGQLIALSAGYRTDRIVGIMFVLIAIGLIIYLVYALMGKFSITPSITIFSFQHITKASWLGNIRTFSSKYLSPHYFLQFILNHSPYPFFKLSPCHDNEWFQTYAFCWPGFSELATIKTIFFESPFSSHLVI